LLWIAPAVDPDKGQGLFWLRMIFGCGALLVFLAAALRTWATAYLRAEVVHDASQHSEALVADGPYRYVRNPLYLANRPLPAGGGRGRPGQPARVGHFDGWHAPLLLSVDLARRGRPTRNSGSVLS